MSAEQHGFRKRLLELEQPTPTLRERHEREMQAMFDQPLTGIRRWSWLGTAVMGAVFAILFGTLAIVTPAEFPWYGRVVFAAGALFGVGWAIMAIRVFIRGRLNLKADTAASAGMAWGLPVIVLTIALVWAPHDIAGLRMILFGLVFLVMGGVFLIRHVVEQSERKTRERLLEIEYRLAELAEAIRPGEGSRGPRS